MSTGLTWVTAYDNVGASEPNGGMSVMVFSDYNEAKQYTLWNAKYVGASYGSNQVVWAIYTESPNQNGYVVASATPTFVPFD